MIDITELFEEDIEDFLKENIEKLVENIESDDFVVCGRNLDYEKENIISNEFNEENIFSTDNNEFFQSQKIERNNFESAENFESIFLNENYESTESSFINENTKNMESIFFDEQHKNNSFLNENSNNNSLKLFEGDSFKKQVNFEENNESNENSGGKIVLNISNNISVSNECDVEEIIDLITEKIVDAVEMAGEGIHI